MLSRSIATHLLPAAARSLGIALEAAPTCTCGALQLLPDRHRRGLHATLHTYNSPPSPLLKQDVRALQQQHSLVHVRHFLSGLTAETNQVYHERRLLGWSPDQLYDVVSRVDQYHKFVPWCAKSTVLRSRPDGGYLEAELEVGFQLFVERYTSKVTLQRPHRVHSSVDDSSLFDHLESTWLMKPGPQPGTTWLVFKVDFAFRSSLYRHVADLFLSEVAKRMIGAFEGRCSQLYGPSSLIGGGRRRVEQHPVQHAPHAHQQPHIQQQHHHPHQHRIQHHHNQQQQQQQLEQEGPQQRQWHCESNVTQQQAGRPGLPGSAADASGDKERQ